MCPNILKKNIIIIFVLFHKFKIFLNIHRTLHFNDQNTLLTWTSGRCNTSFMRASEKISVFDNDKSEQHRV